MSATFTPLSPCPPTPSLCLLLALALTFPLGSSLSPEERAKAEADMLRTMSKVRGGAQDTGYGGAAQDTGYGGLQGHYDDQCY